MLSSHRLICVCAYGITIWYMSQVAVCTQLLLLRQTRAHPVAAASSGPERSASWELSCSLFCWKIASSCSCASAARHSRRPCMSCALAQALQSTYLGPCRISKLKAKLHSCICSNSPGNTAASLWSIACQRRTARRGSCRRRRRDPSTTCAWRSWTSPSGRPGSRARVHHASDGLPGCRGRHGRYGVQVPQMPGRQGRAEGRAGLTMSASAAARRVRTSKCHAACALAQIIGINC